MAPKISVIIPTHNSEKTIENCIKSIFSQNFAREDYEIIVVDDGSFDNTVAISKNANVDEIIEIDPCFQGRARNVGAKKAKGKILAFIDSDCVAESGWLESISKKLEEFRVVTGTVENGVPESKVAWAEYLVEFGGLEKTRQSHVANVFSTCNGACTKEVFDKVGGFVESRASEDFIFAAKLKNLGIIPYFVPEIKIQHICRSELAKVMSNMETLGKFFVTSRKIEPTLPHQNLAKNKLSIPVLFFGKIYTCAKHAIKAGNFGKFLFSFPIILLICTSFIRGVSKEMSNKQE